MTPRKKSIIRFQGSRWALIEFPAPNCILYTYCKSWQAAVDFFLRGDWMGVDSIVWSGQ